MERYPALFALDLWIALAVMLAVSIGVFLLTCRVIGRFSVRGWQTFALSATVAIVVFAFLFLDARWQLSILPSTATVIYGNFLPLLVALLASAVWMHRSMPAWRRMLLIAACVFFTGRYAFAVMSAEIPECLNTWDGNVCLQTSQSSCGPAAAATLLRYHGIKSSEGEMARLCLTTKEGTLLHGMYRGLRIKTRGTSYKVAVRSAGVDELRNNVKLPVILYLKLTPQTNRRDPRYSQQWGWYVGVSHTVVLMRFRSDGRAEVADPAAGPERWDLKNIEDLWQGQYICLVDQQQNAGN